MAIRWEITTLLGLWKKVLGRRLSYVCCQKRITMRSLWLLILVILVPLLTVASALPTVQVDISAAPKIKEGDTIDLSCLITDLTSSETINYIQWKKSGVIYTNFENVTASNPLNRFSVAAIVQSTFRVYTLQISGVQRQDSGMYTCHVGFTDGNDPPSELSQSVIVSVEYYTPPENSPFCQPSTNVGGLTIGAIITLSCSTQKGNPIVNVTWTRETQSGITEEIPLKQINYETDLARLSYTFNVTQEHNGNVMTCTITSEAFPDFERNCTIGPLVVIDVPTNTTATSPWIPTTGKPLQTTLHGPSPQMSLTTSPSKTRARPSPSNTVATTLNTSSSVSVSNGQTSQTNTSSDLITDNPSTPSNSSIMFNATTSSDLATTAFYDLSDNETESSPDPKPGDPTSEGSTLTLIEIIMISAGGIIFLFLMCNVIMLLMIFSRLTNKYTRRNLRSRQSVQRENRRRRRNSRRRHSDIDEETEA